MQKQEKRMHITVLHHLLLHRLNEGDIAQYRIVKHVNSINVHSLKYSYAFQCSYVTVYCYSPGFLCS